jgi:hypothetical protein
MEILAPTSVGDLIDRITILRIKKMNFSDSTKVKIVMEHLARLENILFHTVDSSVQLDNAIQSLAKINSSLWNLENTLRQHLENAQFDKAFIKTVKAIVENNAERANVKRKINNEYNSSMIEQKEYR